MCTDNTTIANLEVTDLEPVNRWLAQVHIILVHPTHAGNIGSVARAMKTMGLTKLTLVKPKAQIDAVSIARASGADDLLHQVTLADNLTEAIGHCTLVLGTSARNRHLPWPLLNPMAAATRVLTHLIHQDKQAKTAASNTLGQVALVFGREDRGLTNAELQQCHGHIHIPTNPDFSSLNLAAAVQVIAYQLRASALLTLTEKQTKPESSDPHQSEPVAEPLATSADMERLFAHMQATLTNIDFLDADNPRHLMSRLRRLYLRRQMDKNEVNILRGILTAVDKNHADDLKKT